MPITKRSYILSHCPRIIYQKHTFFSAVAMVLCALVAAFIVSCAAMILSGLHLAGERSDTFAELAEEVARRLPALCKSLPPALMVRTNYPRQPDYCCHLEVTAETKPPADGDGRLLTTVKVINSGTQAVLLLSLRIVVLNSEGEILAESNKWAATPVTAQPHWRGPLMPGCQRHVAFAASRPFPASSLKGLRTEVEITEIRIRPGQKQIRVADSQVSPRPK